jgi:hypothetical protein
MAKRWISNSRSLQPWQTAFEGFAMSTPVPLRSDFDAMSLRKLARGSRDPERDPASLGAAGNLRWLAFGRRTDRCHRIANRARLGSVSMPKVQMVS